MSSQDDSPTAQKVDEIKQQTPPTEQKEKRPEPERKIIKFDTPEKPSATKAETAADAIKPPSLKNPGATADAAREELEQRRTILQNMKDFDFLIKKNQEDLTTLTNKVESLSKDLDDLVSLYEIVSEQMNPFVGLSKVTKKRLDALENIIKEVDGVKTRIGDLESTLEKTNLPVVRTNKKLHEETAPQTTTPQEKPSEQQPPLVTPILQPIPMQAIPDRELDNLLNQSLESLLTEQSIDAMINEFFINLK